MSVQKLRSVKLSIAAIVVVLVGGIVAWKAYAARQPNLDASGEKIRTFVASDRFKQLPTDQQKQYADAMIEKGPILLKGDKLDPEQEKAIGNMASVHRQGMLDDYFKLPEGKARKDYLDRQIDQQEQIKKMMENPPTTKPGDAPRIVMKKTGGGAAGQKAMAETVPPDQQAKMAQFVHDMQARRAERGLPAGPGGMMIIRTTGSGPH